MPRKCFPEALHDSSLFKVFSVAFYLISINIAFNSVFSSLLLGDDYWGKWAYRWKNSNV